MLSVKFGGPLEGRGLLAAAQVRKSPGEIPAARCPASSAIKPIPQRMIARITSNRTEGRAARLYPAGMASGNMPLTMRNMTGSAIGTMVAQVRNVAWKAGLNRSILDTAPAGTVGDQSAT